MFLSSKLQSQLIKNENKMSVLHSSILSDGIFCNVSVVFYRNAGSAKLREKKIIHLQNRLNQVQHKNEQELIIQLLLDIEKSHNSSIGYFSIIIFGVSVDYYFQTPSQFTLNQLHAHCLLTDTTVLDICINLAIRMW